MVNFDAQFEVVPVGRDDKDSHLALAVFERAKAMAERQGGQGQPFADELWRLWSQRSPAVGAWALLRDGVAAGHLVATVQVWDYEHVAWINQVELDATDGHPATQEDWDAALRTLDEWVGRANVALVAQGGRPIKRFIMCTPHNPKIFERRAGFRSIRTLLERPVRAGA